MKKPSCFKFRNVHSLIDFLHLTICEQDSKRQRNQSRCEMYAFGSLYNFYVKDAKQSIFYIKCVAYSRIQYQTIELHALTKFCGHLTQKSKYYILQCFLLIHIICLCFRIPSKAVTTNANKDNLDSAPTPTSLSQQVISMPAYVHVCIQHCQLIHLHSCLRIVYSCMHSNSYNNF